VARPTTNKGAEYRREAHYSLEEEKAAGLEKTRAVHGNWRILKHGERAITSSKDYRSVSSKTGEKVAKTSGEGGNLLRGVFQIARIRSATTTPQDKGKEKKSHVTGEHVRRNEAQPR